MSRMPDDLSDQELLGLIQDTMRNTIAHSGLWFDIAARELGIENALQLDDIAWQNGFPIQMRRLARRGGSNGHETMLPFPKGWKRDGLVALLGDMAKNWVANDGVWFQAVENTHGMALAKQFNDAVWKSFAVIEAKRIMRRLAIPEGRGLIALERALQFRMYSWINKQEVITIADDAIIFRMDDCRIQSARKRKNLPDYPCKSGGLVEYSSFASAVDSRIRTRCVACPPDPHPDEFYCAWEFRI